MQVGCRLAAAHVPDGILMGLLIAFSIPICEFPSARKATQDAQCRLIRHSAGTTSLYILFSLDPSV